MTKGLKKLIYLGSQIILHYKISSSTHEKIWSQNRKTILFVSFCANLILRVFHGLFTGFSLAFHGLFTVFSWSHLFSQISKVRPQFFKHGISLGVGPCSGKSHKHTTSKKHFKKTSVLKAQFNQAFSKGLVQRGLGPTGIGNLVNLARDQDNQGSWWNSIRQ